MKPPTLRLAEVVASLSLATDLGTGHPLERSLRACLLAVHFGSTLGLNTAALRDLYYITLLRWVGCTADSHRAELFGDEITLGPQIDSVELWNLSEMLAFLQRVIGQGDPPLVREQKLNDALETGVQRSQVAAIAHCEVAQNIAIRLGLGPLVLTALGQLFERWDGRGVPGLAQGEGLSLAVGNAPGDGRGVILPVGGRNSRYLHDTPARGWFLRPHSGRTILPRSAAPVSHAPRCVCVGSNVSR
ncbi:MAG: hypothetical protein IPL78_30430 [Chloroflexi bacterium]|nr:hypothetical protein [Chloroflexota bacterium]